MSIDIYGLTVNTAATVEPLTLAEARTHSRIDDDEEDGYVLGLIVAAREEAEKDLDRRLINTTLDWTLDDFPLGREPLRVPVFSLSSVTSIVYNDTDGNSQTWGSSSYTVDTATGRIQPVQTEVWPTVDDEMGSITITYVAGYGTAGEDVPSSVRHGMLMYIDWLHRNRGSQEVNTLIGRGEIPVAVRRRWDAERWTVPI